MAPVVVGITGSYGKTSTKWYVRDLVSGTRRVVASPASFNNRLGLARAINETLTDDAEVFVAEMGAYQPGEIADTCSWIPPSIAVLTAIGPVHLQRFKSEERIVEAKSEIFEHAEVAIINVDHPALADLAGRPWLLLGLGSLAGGSSLLVPNISSLVSKYASVSERGTVLGLLQSSQWLGRTVSPPIGGALFQEQGANAPLYGSVLVLIPCLAGLLVWFGGSRAQPHKEVEA